MILNNFFAQTRLTLQANSLKVQMARILATVMISLITIMLILSFVLMLSQQFDVRVSNLTSDANALGGAQFYLGFLSMLGVMGWAAATGICGLGTAVLRRRPRAQPAARFLLVSGLLCVLLALDDAFMLHETVLPTYVGIPELVVYLAYLFLLVAYLRYAWFHILATDYLLLVLAFLFLSASIAMDVIVPFSNRAVFVEDVLKFSGIVFWLAYFFQATRALLTNPALRAVHQEFSR